MDQYIMWKLMKVIGKTILEYLSISLARIPIILSGGAWGTGGVRGGGVGAPLEGHSLHP